MRRLLLALALVTPVAVSGCGGAAPTCAPNDGSCLRILFIGNSYTFVNDLPGTLAGLARAQGHTLQVDSLVAGGATLNDHLNDPATVARLNAVKWDYVVLQEQSDMPATAASAESYMFPAARGLVDAIERRGEKPIFFMTWAHRDGDPQYGAPGYETMQRAVDHAYITISDEVDVAVAPVGAAWFVIRRHNPQIELWQSDGSHPTTAGTYLAACVFYAAIYRASPEGSAFRDGLADDTSQILARSAAASVLADPAQWNLR
jgi:hypothetical protein